MELFKRYGELVVDSLIYNTRDYDIDYKIPFTPGSELDISEISIYNLGQDSFNKFTKGKTIQLNLGYRADIGNVIIGVIVDRKIERSDTDKKLTIFVAETMDNWTDKEYSKTFKSGMKLSSIIKNILNEVGIGYQTVELENDRTIAEYSASGTVEDTIKDLVRQGRSKVYIKNNKVVIQAIDKGTDIRFGLAFDTGLIGSPESMEVEISDTGIKKSGWKVECLLNHRLGIDSLIYIDSDYVSGRFRIVRGEHSDWITTLEVVEG